MPLVGAWCRVWIYFGFVVGWSKGARPRFDTSTDMGLVLIPADAEIDSVIFRLRATDQDADFPLVFEITATITPVVRIENLPCTLYNKVCQANVILTKRLIPGRLHDFAVRVRDTKGDSNSMQATISVTNSTTPRDKIFPHIPSLIMVPEDTKPGKELDYLLVRANSWSGKPVYIELWQPKELFTIRQRQTPTQTRGIITLIGELDFETQSMYTLTMYATDPYTEPGKDTRNIAGLNVVVVVQDVQDVPPIFTLAPPLTKINNSVQAGDIILRVHAEDGDKGVPREITYGLVSEGNPFTPFFDISETTGEVTLARSLEELTQITHVGAPVVLTVVAEEIRRSREEPPAQATVVDVGFLLGEPGNSPPYFESDNYMTTINENLEPGSVLTFTEPHSTRVRDEDIGKAGVFALKLEGNNGTFEIIPAVAERTADFIITVRDNSFIDYELYKTLSFKIIAQEVGPATNLSASVPVTIFLRDVNDNPPVFDEESYEVTLSENVTAGTRVVQAHATDKDTGLLGSVQYTGLTGQGSEAFTMDPDTGLITVAMGSSLDREIAPKLLLSVEARDEDGKGNRGVVPLIVHLIDVNDNAPLFEKNLYEFMLNSDLTNFTTAAFIKAIDADAEPPNNEVRYELVHGNYENKFHLNEITGELILRSPITKIRRKKQSAYESFAKKTKEFVRTSEVPRNSSVKVISATNSTLKERANITDVLEVNGTISNRTKRASDDALYTLTARAYDLGVPHLSSVTQIRVLGGAAMEARIMMFVVPGEHPDSTKTAETLAAITGGRVTVLETRPYVPPKNQTGSTMTGNSNKTIVVARVEQTDIGTALVDVEKIRDTLAASGVGIIAGTETSTETATNNGEGKPTSGNGGHHTETTNITNIHHDEVVVYKAENKLLFWLLIILGLLMLAAIAALIICCICPGCPFYMAPRKRRVHSSETLIVRSDGRPKRHLHRKPIATNDGTYNGRKQAWSADPTRRNWQFNRRNIKNCGLASLPGDVAYISGQANEANADSGRLRDAVVYGPTGRRRMDEQERMYMEDVEAQKGRNYDAAEMGSVQRHELERISDAARQSYRQRYVEAEMNEDRQIREQHFYREGNAEVLRLVTRGQADEASGSHHHHYHRQPTTLVIDGKDIILRKFMEDQKSRHDLSVNDMEAVRSMDSHRRSQEVLQQQPEIILIPERLEVGRRQPVDELGPAVQRLIIDHGDYETHKIDSKDSLIKETPRRRFERHETMGAEVSSSTERPSAMPKDRIEQSNVPYSFHDLELAKQNVLLTRLLLERENRQVGAGAMDSTSYLETQSLPGQVAIATQTDRTTATQTERHVRSRSDNDESDEEAKHRKKLKPRKRYEDSDWKRTRGLWMKSPIEEEEGPCFDKRLSILRRKVKEVKEGRRTPLEADVLREISDSLNGNSSSNKEEDNARQTYERSTEQTSIRYKVLNEEETGSPSSAEICRTKRQRIYSEHTCVEGKQDAKLNGTESTSSQDMRDRREKRSPSKVTEKSPRKEGKSKSSKKSDGAGKPSFRILEKEITMLTKKLSKLADKKVEENTTSDSPSQEKSDSTPSEFRKDSDQRISRKTDTSSRGQKDSSSKIMAEQGTISRKEAAIAKTRQKLKYQQTQVMSTGSSEYDDNFEKPKKQASKIIEEITKSKQSSGHPKLKRQSHVERHDKKQDSVDQHDLQKPMKQTQQTVPYKSEKYESQDKLQKPEKLEQPEKHETSEKLEKHESPEKPLIASRPPKLATITRRENIQELSTSESSSHGSSKKQVHDRRDSNKKSTSESSDINSNDSDKPKSQGISKEAAGKITLTSTGTTESSEQHNTDLQKEAIVKETSLPTDTSESPKSKKLEVETSVGKVESEKEDVSFKRLGDKHTQDTTKDHEELGSSSGGEKDKHFLQKLPSVAKHYAEEVASTALGIIGRKREEKDEVKLPDSDQAGTVKLRGKEEDKLVKESPKDTEAAAEGKLDNSTKDSMLLKDTEKQVEERVIDTAGKTEDHGSKEETDSQEISQINEGKPVETTDTKEQIKETVDTIQQGVEEISGFTLHRVPEPHEWIDNFEDHFSDMDVQSDTKHNLTEQIEEMVDEKLSSDDKPSIKETAMKLIEVVKSDVESLKDIPKEIENQSQRIADTIKESMNGKDKESEEEEYFKEVSTLEKEATEAEQMSVIPEEKTAESNKKEDEKHEPVSDSAEEDEERDKSDTKRSAVPEMDRSIKIPKSGEHESQVEPLVSSAEDIEQAFQTPLTPDTSMIQTATDTVEEVSALHESVTPTLPEPKEETSMTSEPVEQTVQSEIEDVGEKRDSDIKPQIATDVSEQKDSVDSTESQPEIKDLSEIEEPQIAFDVSEKQETDDSIEPETKELVDSEITDAKEEEKIVSDIKVAEKEDRLQLSIIKEQDEVHIPSTEILQDESKLEIDDTQKEIEEEAKESVRTSQCEDEGKADVTVSTEYQEEEKHIEDAMQSIKEAKEDKDSEGATKSTEHEKQEKGNITPCIEQEAENTVKTDETENTEFDGENNKEQKEEENLEISVGEVTHTAEDYLIKDTSLNDEDSVQTTEEKVSENEKSEKEEQLLKDLGKSEICVKEEQVQIEKDEPTKPLEEVTPSIIPISTMEDEESASGKVEGNKLGDALESTAASEDLQKTESTESDIDIEHLKPSPADEDAQPDISQRETTEEETNIKDSENIPSIKEPSTNLIDKNRAEAQTIPETSDKISTPETSLAVKEEQEISRQTDGELSPEGTETEDVSSSSREREEGVNPEKEDLVEKDTEEGKSSTKELSSVSVSPESSTSSKLVVDPAQDKAQVSTENKQEAVEEIPKQTASSESTIATMDIPVGEFTKRVTVPKEEEDSEIDTKQADIMELKQKGETLESSEESSDISCGPAVLQVIQEPLIRESQHSASDTAEEEKEESGLATVTDSTKALEPKRQLARGSEATDRETTEDSAEERSFIILDSKPHLAQVERLNEGEGAEKTLPDDPVKYEAGKITSPWKKKRSGETEDKTFLEEPGEILDLPDFTERIEYEDGAGEEYADIDLPIFTSAIDTLDISEDSDSSVSSDVSRKTTLTTRPYLTPRHGARSSSDKESTETKSPPEDSSDKETMEVSSSMDEHTKDTDLESQVKTVEPSDTTSSKVAEDTVEQELFKVEEQETLPDTKILEKHEEPLPSTSSQMKAIEEFVDIQPILKFEEGIMKNGKGMQTKGPIVPKPKKSAKNGVPTVSSIKDKNRDPLKVDEDPKSKDSGKVLSSPKKKNNFEGKKDKTHEQKRVASVNKSQSFKQKSHIPTTQQMKPKTSEQEEQKSRDRSKSRESSLEKQAEKTGRNKRRHSEQEKQKQSEEVRRRHSEQEKQKQTEEVRRRHSDQGKKSRKPTEVPSRKSIEELVRKPSIPKSKPETHKKPSTSEKSTSPPKPTEIDLSKAQPKYMAWYKKNQEEMERRRGELKPSEDDEQLPRWLRRSMRRSRIEKDEKKKKSDEKTPEATPRTKRKVKPLVNVESEQLKAIVRQGRKLRRAEGGTNEDPPIQIYATSPPATIPETRHHLVQHSEYKYEKIPPPFYLHPPPAPHPSPQLSPEHFEAQAASECRHHEADFDSGIAIPVQGTARLRHQQLLEKKSVFDIAYSEAAPSQLRPDSTTPPS